ncbi:hypothetical protein V6N13_071854 [Hibiscus sabdariffa]|uniref:Uncharacterized protein n=1 Tax=Hibiscus sabdariffa TaxID=183260 RepID=A0ABR2TCM4_9ROSI
MISVDCGLIVGFGIVIINNGGVSRLMDGSKGMVVSKGGCSTRRVVVDGEWLKVEVGERDEQLRVMRNKCDGLVPILVESGDGQGGGCVEPRLDEWL